MTLNGSGIRAIARVLRVGPGTVIKELKKSERALAGEQSGGRGGAAGHNHDTVIGIFVNRYEFGTPV